MKSAEGKGAWGEVQRKPDPSLQTSSPYEVTWDNPHSLSSKKYSTMCEMWSYQGSLPEIQCPEFLLGAGHVSNPSA